MLSLQAATAVAAPPARQHEWDPRQLAYYRDLYRQYDIDINTDDRSGSPGSSSDQLIDTHIQIGRAHV